MQIQTCLWSLFSQAQIPILNKDPQTCQPLVSAQILLRRKMAASLSLWMRLRRKMRVSKCLLKKRVKKELLVVKNNPKKGFLLLGCCSSEYRNVCLKDQAKKRDIEIFIWQVFSSPTQQTLVKGRGFIAGSVIQTFGMKTR